MNKSKAIKLFQNKKVRVHLEEEGTQLSENIGQLEAISSDRKIKKLKNNYE